MKKIPVKGLENDQSKQNTDSRNQIVKRLELTNHHQSHNHRHHNIQ